MKINENIHRDIFDAEGFELMILKVKLFNDNFILYVLK